jgi:cobalamin biosynthesis Mg chelatase CobN
MVGQSIDNPAQQSASNDGRGPQRGCAVRPACANARWHRGAMPGGPDHALPGHALDAAHVSAHARLLAQRRWGTPGAAETAASTVGDSQRHAHASADASAAAPKSPAGDAGWLPWLALGGSIAALIGAEIERRRASDEAQAGPAEAGIPFTAMVLYVLAALLAALAIYLFLGQS